MHDVTYHYFETSICTCRLKVSHHEQHWSVNLCQPVPLALVQWREFHHSMVVSMSACTHTEKPQVALQPLRTSLE